MDMMIKVLVVDPRRDRRTETVDALCELPGIEVTATATDGCHAIRQINAHAFDAVVTIGNLPDTSIGTLVAVAHTRDVRDVLVYDADRVGLRAYWLQLGARVVVDTLEDVTGRARELAGQRAGDMARVKLLARQLDAVAQLSAPSASPGGPAAATATTMMTRSTRHAGTPQLVNPSLAVRGALIAAGAYIPREVDIVMRVVGSPPAVRCVPRDLEGVLLHVVLDACAAIPLGGTVWLFVEREGHDRVRIEVFDSGGTPRAAGPGVDLARPLVERHGGSLRVIHHDSGATALQIVWPVAAVAAN